MTEEIIIAGFGGQGVLSMGKILAYSGVMQDKEVSWMPSYGPEMRGGTANVSVIISDERISSPIINQFDTAIILNQQSLDKFESSALYDALIYRKGAAMLHDVRVHMGNDAFIAALRRYYEDNRYRVAAPDALQAALGEAGAALLNAWLRGEAP